MTPLPVARGTAYVSPLMRAGVIRGLILAGEFDDWLLSQMSGGKQAPVPQRVPRWIDPPARTSLSRGLERLVVEHYRRPREYHTVAIGVLLLGIVVCLSLLLIGGR